jgi:hypothetical protein
VTPTTLYAGTWGDGVFAFQQVEYGIYLPLIIKGKQLENSDYASGQK